MSEKKIGIMGGTFNPIHNGHLILAENAYSQYQLDKIYFIPAGIPPHKRNAAIADGDVRCKMVELAISDNPAFAISNIEICSGEMSYTFQTLEQLKEKMPDTEIYFIMGADSLSDFPTWRNPQRICELSRLLVAVRDDLDHAELEQMASRIRSDFHTKVDLLNTPNISISSHDIRNRISDRRSIRYLVPEAVRKYIGDKSLYL